MNTMTSSMKSVGQQLRQAREHRGLTLKAASKLTKIREDQIQKLENDDFAKFHAPTYVRGFVRNYAMVLGLDAREILADLDRVLEMEGHDTYLSLGVINYIPEETKPRQEVTPRSFFLAFAGVLLAGVLLIVVVQVYRVSSKLKLAEDPVVSEEKKEKVTSKGTPGQESGTVIKRAEAVLPDGTEVRKAAPVTQESTGTLEAGAENKLTLLAKEDCWVRVSVMENGQLREVFADIIPGGEQRDFSALKFQVKVGIPAVLDINLNGQNYGPYNNDRLPVEFQLPAGG